MCVPVSTSVYILNRTGPTPIQDKTPAELWLQKTPASKHLKVFGTECFVHIPQQKRKKFDKKSVKGYLIGYNGDDGYRVFIPERKTVVSSRDVIFKPEATMKQKGQLPDIFIDSEPENAEEKLESCEEADGGENLTGENSRNLRDRSQIRKPKWQEDYIAMAVSVDPSCYKEAVTSPEADK